MAAACFSCFHFVREAAGCLQDITATALAGSIALLRPLHFRLLYSSCSCWYFNVAAASAFGAA
jgi:hypothetical protein